MSPYHSCAGLTVETHPAIIRQSNKYFNLYKFLSRGPENQWESLDGFCYHLRDISARSPLEVRPHINSHFWQHGLAGGSSYSVCDTFDAGDFVDFFVFEMFELWFLVYSVIVLLQEQVCGSNTDKNSTPGGSLLGERYTTWLEQPGST